MWPFKKKTPSTLKIPYDKTYPRWIDVYYAHHTENFVRVSERLNKMVPREKYKNVTVEEYYKVYSSTARVSKIDIPDNYKLPYLLALRKFRNEFKI